MRFYFALGEAWVRAWVRYIALSMAWIKIKTTYTTYKNFFSDLFERLEIFLHESSLDQEIIPINGGVETWKLKQWFQYITFQVHENLLLFSALTHC